MPTLLLTAFFSEWSSCSVPLNAGNEEEEWTLPFLDVLPPSLSASDSYLCLCPVLYLVPHDAPS